MNGQAHLWVCTGNNVGRLYTLDLREQSVGRAGGGAQMEIDDERVSSLHCQIVVYQGRHLLRDLGSTNGTYVNNQPVTETFLADGDLIQCGETIFEYVSDRGTEVGRSPPGESVPRNLRSSAQEILHRARGTGDLPPMGHGNGHPGNGHAQARPGQPPPVLMLPATTDQGMASRGPDIPQIPHAPPPPAAREPFGQPPIGHQYLGQIDDDDEDEEINLKELLAQAQKVLHFFLPYWRSIVALTCFACVIGAASYFVNPPKRVAVFEVSLRPETAENPVAGQRYARKNVGFFTSAEQNFRALPLIEKTLRALGETDITPQKLARIQDSMEFVVVGGGVKPGDPITYQGTFTSGEPDWSVRFLKEHFEIYLETEIDKTLKKIRLEAEFLTKRLEDTEKELRRTENALLEFKKENIDGLPEQARQYYDYLFQLRQAQSAAAMNAARLNAEVQMDKQRLQSETPMVEDKVTMTRPYQAAMVDVTRQLAAAKAQGLGPDHPKVLELQAQAQRLRQLAEEAKNDAMIEQRRNPLYDSFKKNLISREVSQRIARQEAARVNRDLRRVKQIVDRLPELEAEYAELNRTYNSTKKLHTQIFETLQTTKMQLDLERASIKSRYDVITPPNLRFVSARKNIMNRATRAGGIGLVLGLLVTALRQLKRMHRAGLLGGRKGRTPAPNNDVKALSRLRQSGLDRR